MPRALTWYDVPAGTRPSQCRGQKCRAVIYWIKTRNGKNLPVDCDVDGGQAPSVSDHSQIALPIDGDEPRDGRGVSHFETCVDVRQF